MLIKDNLNIKIKYSYMKLNNQLFKYNYFKKYIYQFYIIGLLIIILLIIIYKFQLKNPKFISKNYIND